MACMEIVGFVDLEASALGQNGFPIEIGWAFVRLHGSRVEGMESGSLLVRPRPEWLARPNAWSPESEAVHGISLKTLLAEGVLTDEAAASVDNVFGASSMHSDAPGYDGRWLEYLFDGVPVRKRFSVIDFAAATERLTDLGYEFAHREALKAAPRTHRAEADAVHLATVFRLGMEHPQGAETTVAPRPVIGWRRNR